MVTSRRRPAGGWLTNAVLNASVNLEFSLRLQNEPNVSAEGGKYACVGQGGGNVHTLRQSYCSATLSLRYPVGAAAWQKPLDSGRLQVMMMENNEVGK